MSKDSSAGWPDPSSWVTRLYQEVSERYDVYEAEQDPLLRRNKAAGMLGCVISSLRELPPFPNEDVLLPLKDLLIFLADLDLGRTHPWATASNVGGTNITTTAQGELKLWVRAIFRLLRDNGYAPVEAYRLIAIGLTNSGRTGRNGQPFRWQRVQQWCLEESTDRDSGIGEKVNSWWVEFRAAAGNQSRARGQARSDKDIAGEFAGLCWPLPHLRDRSNSVGSE